MTITKHSLGPSLDTAAKLDNVKGNTVLITGGASGLGEAMFERFARHGANVIIADLNTAKGEALVARLRKETGNDNHYFVHCNVTSYDSQRHLFTTALSLSPTRTINTVIANAGVGMVGDFTALPSDLDTDPLEPDLTTLDVNITGVVYTTKLAFHHFRRNAPGEDRHLLLVGSMASIASSPGILGLYTASKHAILGWFRCLYMYPGPDALDVRINLICPYFVATPILPPTARVLLSGLPMALAEDVVEAAARLVCEKGASGRCLGIAPRTSGGVMEIDTEDMHAIEPFSRRLMAALNEQARVSGFVKWVAGVASLIGMPGVLGLVSGVLGILWLAFR
ncbi:NAD(P)-binding protein [Wilcoxina mikolae CBS 423.85]|nr:NAD(P)-binding protein [Wilcoxina mikolae CBS 423.85]